jgi:L-asparaginase II
MVNCTVEYHFSAVLVRFEDGKSLLIQVDTDQEAFAHSCGTELSCITEIESCPSDYYDIAEEE